MNQLFIDPLVRLTKRIIDTDQGQFASVPDSVIAVSVFMAISAILQAGADIIIEILAILDMIGKMPLRLEFLFLAIISAVLGMFTLKGLKRKEIDVTRNSLSLSLMVEVFLIASDIHFLMTFEDVNEFVFSVRLPFMILTTLNVFIVIYIIWRMHIFQRKRYPLKF